MLPLLVFCLITLAFAQVPQPCISPPQWEARIYSYNEEEKLVVNAKLSYDSVYRRVRLLEDIRFGNDDDHYEVIRLFQSKLEFSINMRTGNCSRLPLNRAWRDISTQEGAQSLGEAYIGSSGVPGAGLLVTIWRGNETFSNNETVSFIGTWTYEGCLPVSDMSFNSKSGMTYSSFYDVVGGIIDPNVFIPPRQCLTDKEYFMRHALFGTSVYEKFS